MAEEFSYKDIRNNKKFADDTARSLASSFWEQERNKKNFPFKELSDQRAFNKSWRDGDKSLEPDTLGDIENVGPGKPLGYLPKSLAEKFGVTFDEMINKLSNQGKVCKVYGDDLYVYDKAALADFLGGYEQEIKAAGWPVDSDEFVESVATKHAEGFMYEIVGKAFNDPRYEPGVDYN